MINGEYWISKLRIIRCGVVYRGGLLNSVRNVGAHSSAFSLHGESVQLLERDDRHISTIDVDFITK